MTFWKKGSSIFVERIIILELVVISIAVFGVGWLLNKDDPLFLKSKYQIVNLLVVALSLYYGFSGSLIFLLILSIGYILFYKPFPYVQFLQNLLFALLSSEFRYIWQKKIETANLEKNYAELTADIYRRELFKLKLEYDLLEESIVTKTYSLRRIIEEFNAPSADVFMELISNHFGVYSAELYKIEDGRLISIKRLGEGAKLDPESGFLEEALELKKSFYIPPKEILKKAIGGELAFIALLIAETYSGRYALAIKDMQFLNINEEVFTYITILLEYFGDSIAFESSDFSCKEECDRDFKLQVFRMLNLKNKFGIDSNIVVCEFPEEKRESLQNIYKLLRGLDKVCINQTRVYILLPITSKVGIERFLERMRKDFNFLKVKEIIDVDSFCRYQF
ncbi:PelD GGDEF domain-containing protein [Thermocrinis sp.]